jgi:hypothetical protein
VLSRAVIEASVVSAWLSEPEIVVDERVRRGLVERLHSARQLRRIKDMRPKADMLVDKLKGVAGSFGWPVQLGKSAEDIAVGD